MRSSRGAERGLSGTLRVVVANEPLAYREAISSALAYLRPHLDVAAVDPKGLDEEVRRREPQVVVCSRVTTTVSRTALCWIELYPNHSREATICVARSCTHHPDVDFDTLIRAVDRVESLYRGV